MNSTFLGNKQAHSAPVLGNTKIVSGQRFSRTAARRLFRALLAMALVLVVPRFAAAQSVVAQERITAKIDAAQVSQLKGNIHPLATAQNDMGVADPSLKLERITMTFQPTAAQKADLDSLLAAQQNPTSPTFHKWLTPQQYGDRFGIAPADMAKVTAWLESQGFVVVETPASRTSVVFSGSAAQVRAALQTEIHNYESNGKKFFANSSEPSVPAALSGLVAGFRGLNNFRMEPRAILSKAAAAPQPKFTSYLTQYNFISPADFATIYDLNSLYQASPAINGSGQKIAVVGQSNIRTSDIATFRSLSSLSVNAPQLVLVPGTTDPGILDGDVQESSLDIEWAGAVATNATIIFVYSNPKSAGGVSQALQYAINQNIAPVISMSYGSCEAVNPPSLMDSTVALLQQANAQGITVVVSSGDAGATDCDASVTPANFPAQLGLAVDFPSSTPYVTSIGGTEFNEQNGAFWKAAPSGGPDVINSALSYIPEKVWNDTVTLNNGQFSAGGGGASSIFGKPAWQTGTGVPVDGARDVPDVALNASDAHDPYLVCSVLPGNNANPSGCQSGYRISPTNTGITAYGGTSLGAPTFAGIVALINQKTASTGQGNINYILYPLSASSSGAFHDVITGDNTSPCVPNSIGCNSGGTPIGYSATAGYDQATGLGSVDAAILVNNWSSVTASTGATPTLTSISPNSKVASLSNTDFTLTATGSNFTQNAQILWNGSTAGVTMLPNGMSTSIQATISHSLVAYANTTTLPNGTLITGADVSVTDDGTKAGESNTLAFTLTSTPPANDNIENATLITSSNFTDSVDNSGATPKTTDPLLTTAPVNCYPSPNAPPTVQGTQTVWWKFTATGTNTTNVAVSTLGSSYDTTLSVWQAVSSSSTSLNSTPVACNDDIVIGQIRQSSLTFSAVGGSTYYIMVAPYSTLASSGDPMEAGGKTVLNVTGAPVASAPPVFTSAATATFIVGSPASFTVTATGSPAPTYSVTNGTLPSNLSFDGTTGIISGIPITPGVFTVQLTAINASATVNQTFTMTVNQAPSFTSGTSTTFFQGSPNNITITSAGTPTPTVSTTSTLPSGVTFTPGTGSNAGTGVLAGTPNAGTGGVHTIAFSAQNGVGAAATQQFTLTIDEAPSITSATSSTFNAGAHGSFTVTATGYPVPTFSETGALPAGVTLSSAGVLSGTPATGSNPSYPISITATNSDGSSLAQSFTLNVVTPVLTATPNSETVSAGSPATYSIANAGTVAYTLTCSGLPTGASCPSTAVSDPANSSASLVISTTSRVAALPPSPGGNHFHLNLWPNAFVAIAMSLTALLIGRTRKKFALVPLGALALLMVFTVTGCSTGGSSGPGTNPNGTPAGTYTITITGASVPAGSPNQTTTVTLIVN